MTLDNIQREISARGLTYRGAFHPTEDDAVPALDVGTLVLVGFGGRGNWSSFAASPEANDGKVDPLDRWSRRSVGALARQLRALVIFPFDGPPWPPFQRWAQKSEPLHRSPLGILIHPDWGLWHAWRGALAFRERLDVPPPDGRPSPCESCAEKPCLSACPVRAFKPAAYDVSACIAHIDAPEGADCMEQGCRARRICPVGAEHHYTPDQARFHMRAFRSAQT